MPSRSRLRTNPRPTTTGAGRERRPTAVEHALADAVSELEREDIPFVFLRGHRTFPVVPVGSDVDIALGRGEVRRFERRLETACERHAVVVRERFVAGSLRQYHLHARSAPGRHAFLSIDVHTAEAHFGIPFLQAEELIGDERDARGLRVPAPHAGAWVDFLGPYLSGGVVRADYAARLRRALATDGDAARALGARLFGRAVAAALGSALERDDRDALCALALRSRRALVTRCLRRAPLRSIAGLAAFAWGTRVCPLLRPRGLMVAFLGTDGSGKSTLVQETARVLGPAFRAEADVWHLRPGLLPQLDRVVHLGRATQGPTDWAVPHRAPPSGRLLSNLRVAWYALDYWIGYLVRILPRRRRRRVVLFDRYFYDYLVDPLRFRVRPGTWLVRALAPLVPRPDAVIVLSADVDTIRVRKRELERAECARQIQAYEALAAAGGRFHLVRTDGSPREAVGSILDALFPEKGA